MNTSDLFNVSNRMIQALNLNKTTCTGCAACSNVCPTSAIQMQENQWGFLLPNIDESKCINCKQCENVCPKLHYPRTENRFKPSCYAAQGEDDIRKVSSSGGIFSLLASEILSLNGIVYGASMDENFFVSHQRITSIGELFKLRKSKYVQSNIGDVYKKVKADLLQDQYVLFSGCPCQIAALKNYLGKSYEKLFLIDILCHGVPSNKMLKDYIEESFSNPRCKSIDFRDKRVGWRADCLTIYYEDGTNRIFTTPESEYEIGFQNNLTLRDSCTDCEFCGHQRQGDLTLGDFWHVEDYNPDWKDGKGTSVILINNEKGDQLLDKIKEKLKLLEPAPLEAAERFNRIKLTFSSHPMKRRFRELYPAIKSFNESVSQAYGYKYDIGIVGHWTTRNYGGSLTCYALYSVITEMGYSALMILPPRNAEMKGIADKPLLFREPVYPDYACDRRHENLDDMKELNDRCKMFVVASDQLFNNNLYRWLGQFQILDWVFHSRKKIAYAASYGHDYIWGSDFERAYMANFMKKFDAFSVREDSGVDLSKREFGVNAEWVLDPIFLCNMANYHKIADLGQPNVPTERYIFGYVLDPDAGKEDTLLNCGHFLNMPVYIMHDAANGENPIGAIIKNSNMNDTNELHVLKKAMVNDFLAYIRGCDFMITDSFHGMCLAILFQKPFVVVANRLRGLTRFTSILGLLHLDNRLVYSIKELNENIPTLLTPIDYSNVYKILNEEKKRSKKWLQDNLIISEKKRSLSDYDALNVRCDVMVREYNGRIDSLLKQTNQWNSELNSQAEEILSLKKEIDELKKKQRNIIKRGIQCYKDHGLVYTLKYMKIFLTKK